MKIKEIEKTYKEKVYVAVDGKEFKNEADCKEWEKSYKCTIKQSFDKLPKFQVNGISVAFPYACSDENVFVVEPHSLNDIILINAYVKSFVDDLCTPMDATCIDKKVVVNFGYSDDYFSFALLDDLIKDFNNNIERINNAFAKLEPTEKSRIKSVFGEGTPEICF